MNLFGGNKRMCVHVKGRVHTWGMVFSGDPSCLAQWREDGIECYVIENFIPVWVPASLIRAWCFCQDVFNFKNPWRK
jgi:hypothetical protein